MRRISFRRRSRRSADDLREGTAADRAHLTQFLASRTGVEAFVEPRTTVTDTTILLVAGDGEWTRRRVGGPEGARSFGRSAAIPLYDVTVVGYPARMREYNESRKAVSQGEGVELGKTVPQRNAVRQTEAIDLGGAVEPNAGHRTETNERKAAEDSRDDDLN